MQRFVKNLADTLLGAAVISITSATFSSALAEEVRVYYPVSLQALGEEVVTDPTCLMTNRTLQEMGIVVHPEVSSEAVSAVASVIDCWTTNQTTGIPQSMEGDRIEILGSYQLQTGGTLRLFATVHWTAVNSYNRLLVYEFLLQEGGAEYTIEYFTDEEPRAFLEILADEGWFVEDLSQLFEALRPYGDQQLGGLEKITDDSLQAAVEAIYAVDEHAVSGEKVTDVIYVTDDEVQAIIKVSSVSGDWTLAVNLTHDLLNFTYLRDDSQVGRVAQSLNVTLAQAQAYLTAAGF